jgi:WD40 repeat protein
MAFSPDGSRIVIKCNSQTAKVWDARTARSFREFKGHTSEVISVSFSPDGTRIVTGSGDKTAKVWDARTGTPLLELKGHTATVTGVAFSPDGTRIATGSYDRTAKVWDARTGTPLQELKGHTGSVWSIMFSLDGTRIVTDSICDPQPMGIRRKRVWDARTGQEVLGEPIPPTITNDGMSPDGRFVAHTDGAGVQLIPLQPSDDDLAYRRLYTQPNVERYRGGYESARVAKDGFAARFYLDRLIELATTTNKTDEAEKWRAERAKYTLSP